MPDTLRNAQETVLASTQFAYAFDERFTNTRGHIMGLAGVIQGSNLAECLWCAAQLVRMPRVDLLCVPRVLREVLGTRMLITMMIGMKYPAIKVHLLGFSNDLLDDVATARLPNVHGIDSAVPIRAGMVGMELSLHTGYFDPGPRGDFWGRALVEKDMRLVAMNIAEFRKWISVDHVGGL
jgi:hypothetical protein